MVWNNDVNLLVENIKIIKKSREHILDASKEGGIVVNVEKTKNMYMSCH
jgi:hypothetical protein